MKRKHSARSMNRTYNGLGKKARRARSPSYSRGESDSQSYRAPSPDETDSDTPVTPIRTQRSKRAGKKARHRTTRSPSGSCGESDDEVDYSPGEMDDYITVKRGRGRTTDWTNAELTFLRRLLPQYKSIPRTRKNDEMRKFKARAKEQYIEKFKDDLGEERVQKMAPKVPRFFEYFNRKEKKEEERRELPINGSLDMLKKKSLAFLCMLAGVSCRSTKVSAYKLFVEHDKERLDSKAKSIVKSQGVDHQRAAAVHMKVRSHEFRNLTPQERAYYMQLAEEIMEDNRRDWDRNATDEEIYQNQTLLESLISSFFGLIMGRGRLGMGEAMFHVQYCIKGKDGPISSSLSVSDGKPPFTYSSDFISLGMGDAWTNFSVNALYNIDEEESWKGAYENNGEDNYEAGGEGGDYESEDEDVSEEDSGDGEDDVDQEHSIVGDNDEDEYHDGVLTVHSNTDNEDVMSLDNEHDNSSTAHNEGAAVEWGGIDEHEWGGFSDNDALETDQMNAFTIEVARAVMAEQARESARTAHLSTLSPSKNGTGRKNGVQNKRLSMADNVLHGSQVTSHSSVTDKSVPRYFSSPTTQRSQRNAESKPASPIVTPTNRRSRKVYPELKSPRPKRTRKPSSNALENFAERYQRAAEKKKNDVQETSTKKGKQRKANAKAEKSKGDEKKDDDVTAKKTSNKGKSRSKKGSAI